MQLVSSSIPVFCVEILPTSPSVMSPAAFVVFQKSGLDRDLDEARRHAEVVI